MIARLCIIGVGLIGGSIARAAKAHGLCGKVVGADADPANLHQALELGVIDEAAEDAARGAQGADLVVIATPVGAAGAIFQALRPVWSGATVYTDVGSTKVNVLAAAREVFGEIPAQFVAGHPIAGAERSGVGAAAADLFAGRRVILTPTAETAPAALSRVRGLWEDIGARVSEMAPAHHDEVLAATSHLPHVLAFALVHLLGRKDRQQEIFQYAAGGFRDFTRIASSDPKMWLDICLANRDQLIPLVEELREELSVVGGLLERKAAEELLGFFAGARDARQRFLDQLEK